MQPYIYLNLDIVKKNISHLRYTGKVTIWMSEKQPSRQKQPTGEQPSGRVCSHPDTGGASDQRTAVRTSAADRKADIKTNQDERSQDKVKQRGFKIFNTKPA